MRFVIPGQDQGSYFNEDTNASDKKNPSYRSQSSDSWSQPGMTTWCHCMIILFYSDTRTKEHKNASYEHPSLHPWASSCLSLPNVHQASQACIYNIKHILIRTEKGKTYSSSVLTYKSRVVDTASLMQQHWRRKRTSSLFEWAFEISMQIFCSYVLLSFKSVHPLKDCTMLAIRHPWPGPGILFQWRHKCQRQKERNILPVNQIPGPGQEWRYGIIGILFWT